MKVSAGLLTDRYELTMLSSWVTDGSVENRAVFEESVKALSKHASGALPVMP